MNNNALILRDFYVKTILHLLTQYPVAALMGARQVYLKLTHAFIIHAGDDSFELSHKVTALSAYHLHSIKL